MTGFSWFYRVPPDDWWCWIPEWVTYASSHVLPL